MRRKFSGLTLKDAMLLVPAQNLSSWNLNAPRRTASDILLANLNRMESVAMLSSEAAKILLIDALVLEVLPHYPVLKLWKGEPLKAGNVEGFADYLIAPKRAYVETPLLCAIEAKRDDFEKGEIQCIAEMAVCRDNNKRDGHELDVYGIVSNGQGWVFYKLTTAAEVFVSGLLTTDDLPKLLGTLDFVCAACAKNVP